jgi:hypothetical protein
MSARKRILRDNAAKSLKWARHFKASGDVEYFADAMQSFRMWRAEAAEIA